MTPASSDKGRKSIYIFFPLLSIVSLLKIGTTSTIHQFSADNPTWERWLPLILPRTQASASLLDDDTNTSILKHVVFIQMLLRPRTFRKPKFYLRSFLSVPPPQLLFLLLYSSFHTISSTTVLIGGEQRFRLEAKKILWTGRNKNTIKMRREVSTQSHTQSTCKLQMDSLPKC